MSIPRVKICGITRVQDAATAAQAGADAIGMVFYAASARYLNDLLLARDIAQAVGPFVCVTALFVDAVQSEVEKVLAKVPVNLLQFHGNENSHYCASFDFPYLKALRVKDKISLERELALFPGASGILLDTYVKGKPGGTGESFNWELVPQHKPQAIIVAGGLTPNNVAAALQQTRAYGVDVSGGVESAPGIKSPELIRRFISNAKSVEDKLK